MNKMAKGALATGVGVALLLGGGGTLAVWNATDAADAGTIAAGNLSLQAEAGTWTANGVVVPDINDYRVVPGETLTFSQPLTVDLAGDNMQAKLTVDTSKVIKANGFDSGDLVLVSPPTIRNSDGAITGTTVLTPDSDKNITASVTITFNNTTALSSVNASTNLESVTYKLDQLPVGTPTATTPAN